MAPPVPSSIPSLHAFDPQSTSWKSYRDRIQFYFEANRIVEVKEKKALFLWSIGNATYQLLESLISPRSLTDEDVQFEDLLQILNTHYDDTKNIMTSTYDFYSCLQQEGQSFSEWKADLCQKLRYCGFTTSTLKDKPQDRALRDMDVIGVRNPKIRQALLKEQDPDLEKAEKIIQLAERLYEDVRHFGNPSGRIDVPVSKIQHQQPTQSSNRPSKQNNNTNNSNNHQCATCGSTEHIRETCKYRDYTCNYCKRSGHLARVCRSRPKEEEDETSVKRVTATIFKLDHVDQVTQSPAFTTAIPLRINGHDCSFELDTGALHTIITVNDWNKIGSPIIRTSNLRLKSFGGTLLEIKGECTVNVEYQRQTFILSAIIVNEYGPSLLGLQWVHHLHLDLNSIIYGNNYIPHHVHQIQGHPDLQSLLGKSSNVLNHELDHCTKVQAHIELKPNTTPHTSTGLSPTKKMFQHPIHTEFDLMKPVTPLEKKPTTKYAIGDPVWALNYQLHRPHKWQQAIIRKKLGSMLYEVKSSDGQYHKRHQNQLRRYYVQDNHLSDIESLPDDLENKMPQHIANNSPKQSSLRYPRRNRKPPDRYTPS